jgi:translation initiation factor 5B
MPPKKKGNKKAQDDWEADLGETVASQDGATVETTAEDPAPEDESMGGGLMAALQRRKKKGKKGADQDVVEGEDAAPATNGTKGDMTSKAPEEANFDDDDVFAGNFKPKKGKAAEEKPDDKSEDVQGDAPRVKTKAEKEKEKKEKEKQRKKELVCHSRPTTLAPSTSGSQVSLL